VNNQEFWISRSISVEGFIFTEDNGIRVLANKRGENCPNNIGKWNCPCGYLDYDETVEEACLREIKEETNLKVDPSLLNFLAIDSTPRGKTQNVSVSFWSFGTKYAGQTVTGEGADDGEVDEVEWIGLDELDKYDWAFEHNYTIIRIALDYFPQLLSEEIKRRFEKQLKERKS
jgi:8-oxo-dGTP diphosphatase